jgi:hypothetical protein
MESEGDVMRSDRLKQVMQSLDPNFDERDVGFNKFSKFVVAAGQRGLLKLSKMDNGQLAVGLGSNANVQSNDVASLEAREVPDRAGEKTHKSGSHRPVQPSPAAHLTLSESFELMRQALSVLEAVGDKSTDAERVRTKMVELLDSGADPSLDPRRFPRLLRQAHDAGLIDLIKSDDDGYLLKLSDSEDAASAETPGDEKGDSGTGESTPKQSEEKVAKKTRATKRRKKSTKPADGESEAKKDAARGDVSPEKTAKKTRTTKRRKSTRQSAQKSDAEVAEATEQVAGAGAGQPEPDEVPPAQVSSGRGSTQLELASADSERAQAVSRGRTAGQPDRSTTRRSPRSRTRRPAKASDTTGSERKGAEGAGTGSHGELSKEEADKTGTVKRNPRYRRGSRGGTPRVRPTAGDSQEETGSEKAPHTSVAGAQVAGRRGLGLRKGSKGGTAMPVSTGAGGQAPPAAAAPRTEERTRTQLREESPPKPAEREPAQQSDSGDGEVGSGFFKRITAVFQRAVQGEQSGGENDS